MSKVGSMILLTDSESSLTGGSSKYPLIKVKPCEDLWNGMQTEDPLDPNAQFLFKNNAEIINDTSGIVEKPRWLWADSIVDVVIASVVKTNIQNRALAKSVAVV